MEKDGYGYGKRPMWQWILIYLIVGGVLYYGIYYFFLKGDSSSSLYNSSGASVNSSLYGN